MTGKVWIVGMRPSSAHSDDGSRPVTHPKVRERLAIRGKIGRRLADLCELEYEAFLDRFERRNLVDDPNGPWPKTAATLRARELAKTWPDDTAVVCLGRDVWRAFEMPPIQFFQGLDRFWTEEDKQDLRNSGTFNRTVRERGVRLWLAPHPSGLSRWWNDPSNEEEARQFWTHVAAYSASRVEEDKRWKRS